MSNLLLEFTKKDETELYQDQDIFTISYEIELDTDNPDVWMDRSEYSTSLADLVGDDAIYERASEIFSEQDVSEFYDHIGSSPSIGEAFVEWANDSSVDAGGYYSIMIRVANGLGLLGENIDEDLLKDLTEETLSGAINDLHSGESKEAKIALAKNIMSNRNLKDYIEDQLEISLPDPDQIDMFGEDSKLEAIGNLILKTIPDKDEREKFIKNLFINSFEEVGEEKRNYAVKYVDYLRNYIEEIDRLEPASIDQTEEEQERIENLNDIYDLILDNAVIEEIFKQIPQEINNNADNPTSINEFYSYNMYADGIPADIESDFEEWIQSEFEGFRDESINNILENIYGDIETYFDRDDYIDSSSLYIDEYMIEQVVRQFFPKFYKKWGDILTFTTDASIPYGFEMFPTTYLTSINEAFEFLKDFYKDYENQNTFEFNRSTGLHTNIGIVKSDPDSWNYFKGFLFLNDNFATRGFEERLRGRWSKSIRDAIMNKIKNDSSYVDKTSFRRAVIGAVESNFDAIESAMNSELKKLRGSKEFGFNIQSNRIEFRYPGGDLSIESLKDATLYYAYIVKLITDPQFKRREYLKKATAFVLGMGDDLEQLDREDTNFKNINRAFLIIKEAVNSNPNPEPLFKISKSTYIPGITNSRLDPDILLNGSRFSNITPREYITLNEYGEPGHKYIKINSLDDKSKTINATEYFLDNAENILFAHQRNWGWRILPIRNINVKERTINISAYKLAQAIMSKEAIPASSEEYAKIKLFTDPNKTLQQLERTIPWMRNFLKARDIIENEGFNVASFILKDENLDEIINGNFEKLISDIKNNEGYNIN